MSSKRTLVNLLSLTTSFLLALSLLQLLPAFAMTIQDMLFVKPEGSGSVCSQAQPCSLPGALAQSVAGDTLVLAGGVYSGTGATVLETDHDLDVLGGWNGAASGPILRDPGLHPTILDGQGSRRVVRVSGVALVLEGLVLFGGKSSDGGAGIRAENASLTLRHDLLAGNNSDYDGGAVFVSGGTAEIIGNTLIDNHANWGGGLRLINNAGVFLMGNQILNNTAVFSGGGIDIECCGGAIVIIARNLIQGNDGGDLGGGVNVSAAHAVLENNILAFNHADQGSGVYLDGFPLDPDATAILMTHNTLVGDGSGSEALFLDPPLGARLINNLIAGHPVGITMPPGDSLVVAENNLFWNQSDPFTGTNAVIADPLLDATFHLTPLSPAIDAGSEVELVDDIDGDPRPLLDGYDIGADEYSPHLFLPLGYGG